MRNGSYEFLHKDYIGSILAISDEAGNKLEQRHFDAWGNFTHLQIGNGAIITDQNVILSLSKDLVIDRGYTSHEHFAEVGIIHMNGRLYDPLLRRFLNADENIQDPYNTQNYNKYGYVMNNPLMFNDPTGESLVGWLAAGFIIAPLPPFLLMPALYGAAISGGVFIIKSLVTGNWSWGGFAKSLLIGAVTGAATGGLTGGLSASGFQGAVIVGSMNGAISGGIDALFNGENFFTGMYRGAIFGAATAGIVSGISWVVNQLSIRTVRFYMEDNGVNTLESGTPVGNRSYARDLYEQFGVQDALNKNSIYNDASRLGGKMNSDGAIEYTYKGKIIKALGVTDARIDQYGRRVGKIRMFLSNKAFASREQLAFVMQHELNHVRIANAGLSNIAEQSIKLTSKIAQKYGDLLENVCHYHIQESGASFLENNGWHNIKSSVPSEVFNTANFQMANEQIWKLLQGTDKTININFK